MSPTKLVMKLIENEKKRKSTYKTRRDGLVQKVSELAALCGTDAFLVCVMPGAAGGKVTTWPADRRAVQDLVTRFRETPPEKIKENWNTTTYLQDVLDKEQRKLIRLRECRLDDVLTPWDSHLDELSVDGLNALNHALGETLQSTNRRIAALGGHVHEDVVAPSAVAVVAPAQHSPAFLGNALDLSLSGASSSVGAQDKRLPRDILPQPVPVHLPCFAFPMPPPCLTFQMPAPLAIAAPPGFGFTGAGIMGRLPYDSNVVNGGAADTACFYGDFVRRGFAAGAGYHLGPRMTVGVWPLRTLHNSEDDSAYQV